MRTRPRNDEELQKREAIGVIRASRFVRQYAHSHKIITFETISQIHKEIFKDVWSEIAGKYREENLEISASKHLPPHYSEIFLKMKEAEGSFEKRLRMLKTAEGILSISVTNEKMFEIIQQIVSVAGWLHHVITFIHPFREGNGRTARLAANLILERYGLMGISIRIEKENKNRYRQALAQIDQKGDYEPLESLIFEGLIDRYNGLAMKYYSYTK